MEFTKTVMTVMTVMQGSKRDADVKNRLLDYMGEARMGYFERIALKHAYYYM